MKTAAPPARMAAVSDRRRAMLVTIVALTSACSSSHRSATPYTVSTTTVGKEAACDATRTMPYARLVSSSSGSVWVWVESATREGFRTGSLVKVVWRITGRGAPTLELQQPDGRPGALSFGPERHSSSTFRHPGDEYGSGFIPTTRGCWRMNIQRGKVSGKLSFLVA